jgi:hypothetical protein
VPVITNSTSLILPVSIRKKNCIQLQVKETDTRLCVCARARVRASCETQCVSKISELILDISRGTALLCKSVITFYYYVVKNLYFSANQYSACLLYRVFFT